MTDLSQALTVADEEELANPNRQFGHSEKAITAPLKTPLLLGYGVGQAGAQIFRDLPSFVLPAYMSTILGVPGWLMGVAIFVPKLWIIFCDLLVGGLSDRTRSRLGRRRPFLLVSAIACPMTLILLFSAPHFSRSWESGLYVCILFTLAMSVFSLFSVPYLALGAEISVDSHQRTRLMSFRLVFVAVGLFASIGLSPSLIAYFGGDRHAYSLTAIVLGGICFAAMMGCFFGVASAPQRDVPNSKPLSLRDQARVVADNKPFTSLLLIHFIHLTGQAAGQTVTLLFFIYVAGHPGVLLWMSVFNAIAIIACQPAWVWGARRFGKKAAFVFAVTALSIDMLSWGLVHADAHAIVDLPLIGQLTAQDLGVIARHIFTGLVSSGITLMSYSIFTDTVDDYSARTGTRHEGIFSGVWSGVEKLGFASGPLLMGWYLSAFGLVPSDHGVIEQDHTVVLGLLLAYSIIPAIFYIAPLPLILRLPNARPRTAETRSR